MQDLSLGRYYAFDGGCAGELGGFYDKNKLSGVRSSEPLWFKDPDHRCGKTGVVECELNWVPAT